MNPKRECCHEVGAGVIFRRTGALICQQTPCIHYSRTSSTQIRILLNMFCLLRLCLSFTSIRHFQSPRTKTLEYAHRTVGNRKRRLVVSFGRMIIQVFETNVRTSRKCVFCAEGGGLPFENVSFFFRTRIRASMNADYIIYGCV